MSMKEAYEKKLQSQMDEWSAPIDTLKAKVEYRLTAFSTGVALVLDAFRDKVFSI